MKPSLHPINISFTILFIFFINIASSSSSSNNRICSSSLFVPSYPFSSSIGCGHPSFQVRCISNRWIISINSTPFVLLSSPTSHSLLISPSILFSPHHNRCEPLPTRPIDLSSSPFRFPNLTCSDFSSLCDDSSAQDDCPLSAWQRRLLLRPLLLLGGCAAAATRSHKCTNNAALADFLRSGIRVDWDDTADPYFSGCSSCRGVCGFNASDASKPFLCLPSDEVVRDHGPSGLVLLSCLFAFLGLLSIAVVATAIFLRAGGGGSGSGSGTSGGFGGRDPMAGFLRLPPVYTYDQLSLLTEGFDPKHKIGDGGFGSVYIARLGDGRTAAIKKLHVRPHRAAADSSTRSFCNEIMILSSIDHPNLVKLHGYCCDRRGLVLVYDYVPNGTLADHLHGSRRSHHVKSSFTWPVRVDIALQTALVLEYLHYMVHPPVVHRDITSSNIFIDEEMLIKVGDFGLSRLLSPLPSDQASSGDNDGAGSALDRGVWTGPQGTPGYLDPEYHRSFRLTEKSDVYSFGVVLLELVTGMRAVDPERDRKEVGLADLAVSRIQSRELRKMVDPDIMQQGGESMMGTVEAVAELAFRCVASEKDDRPDSRELVAELRRIRNWVRRTHSAADDGCKE